MERCWSLNIYSVNVLSNAISPLLLNQLIFSPFAVDRAARAWGKGVGEVEKTLTVG